MRYLLLLNLFIFTVTSYAEVIQSNNLQVAQQKVAQLPLAKVIKIPSHLEQQLAQLPKQESMIARSKALQLLSEQHPTTAQRQWVELQLKSAEILQTENPDHPEQLLTIINIANQAKTVTLLWQINTQAESFLTQWQKHQWQWQSFLQKPSALDYQALSKALDSSDSKTNVWLINELNNQAVIELIDNRLLSLLTEKNNNLLAIKPLLSMLWQRPADQYSYQTLQQITQNMPESEAINELISASKNQALTSQALLLLAQKFPNAQSSQEYLLKQLTNPQTAWYAAMASQLIKQEAFQQKIKQLARQKNSPALNFVISQQESK